MKKNLQVFAAAAAIFLGANLHAADVKTEMHNDSAIEAAQPQVRQVTGEITWVDTKIGKLQIEEDVTPRTGEVKEYRISEHETRVESPLDKKFLSVKDLRAGQYVVVDTVVGRGDMIVAKVTANPRPTSTYQEAYGTIEAIDPVTGTLTISGRLMVADTMDNGQYYFTYEPSNVVILQSPGRQVVRDMGLKVGDIVKIEFVVVDGKRQAHSITLYTPTPRVTSVTTTTTVTQ